MSQPPRLIDPVQRARNLARASDTFLQDIAANSLKDRVALMTRAFEAPAVVTPFVEVWRGVWPDAHVTVQQDTLELEPDTHDLIIHAMGLHWDNDPVGQLIQCRRALKPDGLLIAMSLGGQTLQELRTCLAEAEARVTGGLSPRIAPMAEIRDLGALLQRAGLALPVADSFIQDVAYRDVYHLMRDLRSMGETNALTDRLRRFTPRSVFAEAGRLYAEHYASSQGLVATFEFITLTGWAPDASQPQPLRPGSATNRLSEALGSVEHPLKD